MLEPKSDFVVIYPSSFNLVNRENILIGSIDLLKKEIHLVRAVHKECERFSWSGLSEIGSVVPVALSSGFCCTLGKNELETLHTSGKNLENNARIKFYYDGVKIKKKECKTQREFNDLFYSKHILFYCADSITLSDSDCLTSISENLRKDISFIVPGLDRIISSAINYSNEVPLDPNELRPRKYIANINITLPIIDVRVITGSLSNSNLQKGETQIKLKTSTRSFKLKELQLRIFCLLPTSSLTLSNLLHKFSNSIIDQISESLSLFKSYPHAEKTKVYHFCPEDQHIVTAIYPMVDNPDESLTSLRMRYHQHYYVPHKPVFRIVQALDCGFNEITHQTSTSTPSTSSFSSSASSSSSSISFTFAPTAEPKINSTRLKNVHLALSAKENGSVCLVRGTYDYYHYMQDSFNDNGWGCAYRSCQTIESWYYNEGLSRKPIQNHREIQKTIFTRGERKKGFIGSTEWIGSLEIQSVLASYLNVDSKILHISKGSDILNHLNTLKDHFNNHGTPVMIGGGQLAYTLLGIYTSGHKTLFLILDPHYTGKDDLKIIIAKGWCGWKEKEAIFHDTHFYNLCFPQVSNAI